MKMRETRYLWVGNLGENVREDKIADYFRRYGKIDKVRFLSKRSGDGGFTAYVAFMDIRSAQKAKTAVNVIGDRELLTDYFDPVARSGNEESQRHEPSQQSQSRAYRRYEGIKNSGPDERSGRDSMPLSERSYQTSETGSNNGNEKVRMKSDLTETKPRSQSSSKKRADVKISKKKTEDLKAKAKKGPQKWSKERGRSPTVKQRKSYTSSGSSPSRSAGSKRLGSSTEGRSSSSVSVGGRSISDGHRSSSASSSSSSESSNSSKTHRSNSESSESSYEVEEKPESRKLVPMCIRKLPIRPTIASLRDGIFHEFKKYGKVKSVLVRGDGADRHALVLFRTAAEASKAVAHARTKLLFGAAIEASIYEGEVTGQELEECGGIIDEFHPRASRTLFVGNLDKTVAYSDIQNIFVRFGEIVAIEIKKQHNIPQYAFLQYTDIMSVVRAITKMDGEKLGRNTLKLGFGKTVISSCLWVDGVTDSFTENYLSRCFQRYGPVKHVVIDRSRGQALVFYAQYEYAQSAMQKLRARKLNGSRLKMDYASNELVEIFLKHMKNSGQSFQGLDSIRQLLQPPSSPVSTSMSSNNAGYTRSSIPQENRSAYYEERHQSNYSDEQYTDGNYRRSWRGRSRERHPYPVEQTSYNRPKRSYEDSYSRPDYHRESTWEHESYTDGRGRLSQHDQDYRQRDYDFRRDHRGYVRKQSSRSSIPYDDPLRYRGSRDRDRYRDERDSESVRDRDPLGDRYYSRSVHLSPSHPRYHPRRSRSVSPHPRDQDRYPIERGVTDAPYRRRGSGSPDVRYDSLHRMNSMDSKSSSHSESRYPVRSGDVDMREYMEDDKLSVSSRHSDERIVEFTERATKLRVRKRVSADLPTRDSSLSPHSHYKYRGESGSVQNKNSPDNYAETLRYSDSPEYSGNSRSVGGTPTRDENEDLIGEVIIKKSGSRVTDKSSSLEKIKPHQKGSGGDVKLCDKDYRKDFTSSSASIKSDSSTKSRSKSRSTSLIKRVHSPPDLRKESIAYEKDFDYRKPPNTGSSKTDSHGMRPKRPKASRPDELTRANDTGSDYDQQASPSERRVSTSGPSLLKREYSPKLKEKDDHMSKRTRNPDLLSSKEKYKEHKRKIDNAVERDETSRPSLKRRHSQDAEASAARVKRERKSISEHHKHKSSHDQSSQRHEAPMSIASQMFLRDEEDSGGESPETTQEPDPVEIQKHEIDVEESFPEEKPESPGSIDIAAASLSAAKSLLPKAFSKPPKQVQVMKEIDLEKRKKEGNLTELEKEKERLQKLLSKLDSEKQLNPKDAEEVADVVLQELTQKARSKLNIGKETILDQIVKEEDKLSKEKTEVIEDIVDETVLEIDKDEETDPLGSDDVTFEEEVVVDTIEEVTEDEIIETEVEEVTVKDEEEAEDSTVKVEEVQEIVVAPEPVEIVVKPTAAQKIDNSMGYRKQMEAQRKEMEKIEKKKDSQRKKILKKQEKEKKKQIERVSAMRGPGQSVVSSVDDDMEDEASLKELTEVAQPVKIDDTSEHQIDEPVLEDISCGNQDKMKIPIKDVDSPADVELEAKVARDHIEIEQLDSVTVIDASDDVEIDSKGISNEELWPPDRGKDTKPSSEDAGLSQDPKDTDENTSTNSLQPSGKILMKNATPTTPNSTGPNTPIAVIKDSSPKISVQSLTPSSSIANSQSQKTQTFTTNRTPVFTTPSPASSSSNSSSKSQRHKQMKMASHQRHAHSSRMGQSRTDHSSRSHGHYSSNADHRRPSSHSHRSKMHIGSSSGQNHLRSDGHKKPVPQMSRRSLATITVGLDASPSKPLSRNELERLRHELESVRNQLNAESVSPSSLSPCSDDENGCKSRSPAQLLSPVSPLLKSPGNVMAQSKRSDGHFPAILQNSSPATSSLTDRLKLLGKVKKRTSSVIPEVKAEPPPAPEHVMNDQAESMNSRIYRSSIIDQDSERLSHISQGLVDNNLNNLHQTITPSAQNVPLFSGSKFLQPGACPPSFQVISPLGHVENSVTPNSKQCIAIMPNERTGIGNEMCNESPISSNSGPKNVISLSSSNLPVTAERLSVVFGKKNDFEIVGHRTLVTPKEEICSEEVASSKVVEPSENIAHNRSIEMSTSDGELVREAVPPNATQCSSMDSTVDVSSQLTELNLPDDTSVVPEPTSTDQSGAVAHRLQTLHGDPINDTSIATELDLEPGSCMEISSGDVVIGNTGEDSLMMDEDLSMVAEGNKEAGKSESSPSEIDSLTPIETQTVIDVSKKPEKPKEDIDKKKAKPELVIKNIEGSEDGKSKKEKQKIEKKKLSNKNEVSKTKVSSKHKLSKEGRKEKVVKKDIHKKAKTEAVKTKSFEQKQKGPEDDTLPKAIAKPSSTTSEKPLLTSSEQQDVSKEEAWKFNMSQKPDKKKICANDREERGDGHITGKKTEKKSLETEEKVKIKSEKRENVDAGPPSGKDKSDGDKKSYDSKGEASIKSGKIDSKPIDAVGKLVKNESRPTDGVIKKKKKKKHTLDKKDKHSEQKQAKQLQEGKCEVESLHLDKSKKKLEGNEKIKKTVVEKPSLNQRHSEKSKSGESAADGISKSGKESTKSLMMSSMEKSSSGSSKKDKTAKKMKVHSDLKVSHSAPSSTLKKVSDGFEGRKKLKKSHTLKKEEKMVTRKGPQPLIFSDSSDNSNSNSYSWKDTKATDHSKIEEYGKLNVDDHKDDQKWSDLDEAEPEKRHLSASSSSSNMDSVSLAVSQSAMLTTETIKNETILPDDYKSGAFSGSSEDEDFGDISQDRPFALDARSSTLSRNQKSKPLESKLKSAESKTSQKPVFSSSSDSDSSENRLVMLTDSESSDNVSKPKKSLFKRSAMTFSDEENSDYDVEPERRAPRPQLKALPLKAERRMKASHGDKTKTQKPDNDTIPGHDRKTQSKKYDKLLKKSEAKSVKKHEKAHKKEKRKVEASSDNDSDIMESSKPSSKMKLKHPSKVRKLDIKHEQSPTKSSAKLERKPSWALPKMDDRKEKHHSKGKKHKDSKTRMVKVSTSKSTEQEFEKSGMKGDKSDVPGLPKKEKSYANTLEDPKNLSRQTLKREFIKHSKKSSKHQKKSELSSSRSETAKSDGEAAEKNVFKDGRSKKDHKNSEKSHKQERERLKKEKKLTVTNKKDGSSKDISSKKDEKKLEHENFSTKVEKFENIGYSLFGSDSDDDDDDDNFMIDEDRDDTLNMDEIPSKLIETETRDIAKSAENDGSKSANEDDKKCEENFMGRVTSDESDNEQKEAVKSAISTLDQDHEMRDMKPDINMKSSRHEASRDEISEAIDRPFDKPPPRPRSLSPLKKVTVTESSRNRKSSHDLCDVKREKFSSLNPAHSAYPVSQRHLSYGKDRWERMDKMKSISHEREEEAVRSIMGILDESSDADSYFSDVNIDKASGQQSTSENVVQDVERSNKKSKDSVKEVQTCVDSLSEEADKEGESSQENEDFDDELAKTRSTAEENELAAAVSAIEGLFGDFPNDTNTGDSFIPENPHQPTSEKVPQKESTESPVVKFPKAEKSNKVDVEQDKSKKKERKKSPYRTPTPMQKSADNYQYSKHEITSDLIAGGSGQLVSSAHVTTSELELPTIRPDHRFSSPGLAQQQQQPSSYKEKDPPDATLVRQSEATGVASSLESVITPESALNTALIPVKPIIKAQTKENMSDERDKTPQEKNMPETLVKHGTDVNVVQVAATHDSILVKDLPFVSTVQPPGPRRKSSETSAASLPFVAVSTTVVTQPSIVLPVNTTDEQPVNEPQKSVDQMPMQTSNTGLRELQSDQRRSSFATSSSSSLGGYVSKPTSKPELSKQSSVPTSTHVSTAHPQLHHPRLSVPMQPTVSLKTAMSTTVVHSTDPGSHAAYSHAHNPPFVGYQEQMMPIRTPVLPQPHFGLTQSRFATSQVPTATIMPFQHTLTSQQPDPMSRAIQSPYLLQHSVSTPHNTSTVTEATAKARIRENQQSIHNQPAVDKQDTQRNTSSNQNAPSNSNAPMVPSSVPVIPQLPPQYLHPAQAGMQQKSVYPPHMYFAGAGVPTPFPPLTPYMNPFIGMRSAVPSIPIVRTVAEDASRQTQKPLRTPPPRAMPPHAFPPRREQPTHIPMSRPSYAVNPQVAVHPTFPAQHPPAETRHPGSAQMHQSQYVKHDASHYQPQRTEHSERFVRADSEQSQTEMVEQHFALSGITPGQPPAHNHQPQTPAQDNKGYPPAQEGQTSTAMRHQPPPGHSTNVYPSVVPRHVLGVPHGLLPHGEKYTTPLPDVLPWPYSGGNFRPPSIPSQQAPPLLTPHAPDIYQGHVVTTPNPTTEAPAQVMDLFQRYPVIWQGLLALKNDSAAVQTHFICGDRNLAQACLPQPDSHVETDNERNLAVLRIVQRMRLEPQQLEGIDNRIMENSDYCLLLALPCGRDQTDVNHQQCALKRSFIDYLKQKQAAGIVNVQHQVLQSNLQYVLHVFPPCDFTTKHLQCHARDLLSNINDIQHIMIVIAAV